MSLGDQPVLQAFLSLLRQIAQIFSAPALILVVFCFFELLDCYEHHYSRLHVKGVIFLITAVFIVAREWVGYSIRSRAQVPAKWTYLMTPSEI